MEKTPIIEITRNSDGMLEMNIPDPLDAMRTLAHLSIQQISRDKESALFYLILNAVCFVLATGGRKFADDTIARMQEGIEKIRNEEKTWTTENPQGSRKPC